MSLNSSWPIFRTCSTSGGRSAVGKQLTAAAAGSHTPNARRRNRCSSAAQLTLESRARNAALSRSRKNREAGAGSTHSTRNGGFEVSLSGILPLCSNSVKPACSVASAVQRPTRSADSAGRMACNSEDRDNFRNGKLEAEGEHPRLPAGSACSDRCAATLAAGLARLLKMNIVVQQLHLKR